MNKEQPSRPSTKPPRPIASESGVLTRMVAAGRAPRPSWDEVDEYVREGKHSSLVERYAAADPDFAEVVRWMRNDLEAEEIDVDSTRTPLPTSAPLSLTGARALRISVLPAASLDPDTHPRDKRRNRD